MVGCCWVTPFLFSLPSTPMKREAGEGCGSVAPACLSLSMLSIHGEGETLWGGVGCRVVAESVDRSTAPSAWGDGAGSMVGGGAGPSQRESERE